MVGVPGTRALFEGLEVGRPLLLLKVALMPCVTALTAPRATPAPSVTTRNHRDRSHLHAGSRADLLPG